jgi:DNA-binding CsgD family transcriptional regulator
MGLQLDDVAWHRTVGRLIDSVDQSIFWPALVRALADYLHFDSWVVLMFYADRPPEVFAEMPGPDGGVDALFQDYLAGLYLLDPFYIASRENPSAGLIRLDEVAPDRFQFTDYYQRYFRLNIVKDEVQFNQAVDEQRTFCLSLGSAHRFLPEAIATLALVQPWVTALMRQRLRFERTFETSTEPINERNWQQAVEISISKLKGTSLTIREVEVTRWMLGGFSSKGIAQKLAISVETVRAHKKHIYSKLGISSQSELFSVFLQAQQAGTSIG